jgi:Integrase core domain
MIALLCFFLTILVSPLKSKSRLEAENVALRRQLIILRRKVHGRVHLTNGDRLFFVQLYRWFPSVLNTITIIRPETLVRWHRAGFRRYWRWKSRSLAGRPQIDVDLRALIRRMSISFAERLIGSIRRECADHVVALGEAHLRRILQTYAGYYNDVRTHRSLDEDAPFSRPVQRIGCVTSHALLGGLHHHYCRI